MKYISHFYKYNEKKIMSNGECVTRECYLIYVVKKEVSSKVTCEERPPCPKMKLWSICTYDTRLLQAACSIGLHSTCSKNVGNGMSEVDLWQVRLDK